MRSLGLGALLTVAACHLLFLTPEATTARFSSGAADAFYQSKNIASGEAVQKSSETLQSSN